MTIGEEEEQPFHLYASTASQQLLEPLRTQIRETLHQFVRLFKTLSPRQLIEQLKDRPLGRRQNEAPIPLPPRLDEKAGVRSPARLRLDALDQVHERFLVRFRREEFPAVAIDETDLHRETLEPIWRRLGSVKVDLFHRLPQVVRIPLYFERGASADHQRFFQNRLKRDHDLLPA